MFLSVFIKIKYNTVKKIPEFLGMINHVEVSTIVNLQKLN